MQTDADGYTPLMIACENNDLQLVRSLLATGADPNLRCNWGWTALMEACDTGNAELVEELLRANANASAVDYTNGWTPLSRAAYRGSAEVVKLLLRYGAYIKYRDQDGSALTMAVREGHQEVVKVLVDAGAPVDPIDKQHASEQGHVEIFNLLSNPDVVLLHEAAREGNFEVVLELISKGVNIDSTDMFGWTAVMTACYHDRVETVKVLLAAGADITTMSHNGTKFPEIAWKKNNPEILKLL